MADIEALRASIKFQIRVVEALTKKIDKLLLESKKREDLRKSNGSSLKLVYKRKT